MNYWYACISTLHTVIKIVLPILLQKNHTWFFHMLFINQVLSAHKFETVSKEKEHLRKQNSNEYQKHNYLCGIGPTLGASYRRTKNGQFIIILFSFYHQFAKTRINILCGFLFLADEKANCQANQVSHFPAHKPTPDSSTSFGCFRLRNRKSL